MKLFIVTHFHNVNGIPSVRYRGISADENKTIFDNTLDYITEDIACFVAIIHALGINKKEGKNYDVYTNNKTAKQIVESKRITYEAIIESRTNTFIKKSTLWLLEQKKDFTVNLYE